MAINIVEYDYGTKAASRKMLWKLQTEHPEKFRKMYFYWLQRVYQKARQFCPVDTGALRASIRVVEGDSPYQQRPSDIFKYTAAAGARAKPSGMGPVELKLWLVAGGGGYINPKKGTEVDYAQIQEERKHFLTRAMRAEMPTIEKMMDEHWKWIQKTFYSGQPNIGGMWKLPTKLVGKYSHLVY